MQTNCVSGPVVNSLSSRAVVGAEIRQMIEQATACSEVLLEDRASWHLTVPAVGHAAYVLGPRKEAEVLAFWRGHGEALDAVVAAMKADPEALATAEAAWAAEVAAMASPWTPESLRRLHELQALRAWWAMENEEDVIVLGVLEDAIVNLDLAVQFGDAPRPPWDLDRLFEVEDALNPDPVDVTPWWRDFGNP